MDAVARTIFFIGASIFAYPNNGEVLCLFPASFLVGAAAVLTTRASKIRVPVQPTAAGGFPLSNPSKKILFKAIEREIAR
jgi:hypothetical protein